MTQRRQQQQQQRLKPASKHVGLFMGAHPDVRGASVKGTLKLGGWVGGREGGETEGFRQIPLPRHA